tara:strand:- start:3060 stop:3662 length:603 start_codon:yes stop_codon:yes gene_type:complete
MKKIVLFLHGYGSNGNDLISLKDYILLDHSNTEFLSPNAPEPCELNFFGYQWFALKERSHEELKLGLNSAFKYLDEIIQSITEKYNIGTSQLSIIGFSQGSMLATYYALQKNYNFNSIISLAGSLPKEILENLNLVKNKTRYLIFHGKLDDVIHFDQAIHTHNFLNENNINSELVLDENCAHSVSQLALESINNLYKLWI